MDLSNQISKNTKEIFGSRTKNRLTIQISYAIQLIMEFYSLDFLIMMDYIEDVAVIENPESPNRIMMYQVKTKTSDRAYSLNTVINEQWFDKLYSAASKYEQHLVAANLVCNTDIVERQKSIFPNRINRLNEESIQLNIIKIRESIAKNNGLDLDSVDLSKYYFIRSSITTCGHKEQVEHEFESFLLKTEPELQITVARTIYGLLYGELDNKFNYELDPNCNDLKEIFEEKCVSSTTVKELVANGLLIQLPDFKNLLDEFDMHKPALNRELSIAFRQIKVDMCSDSESFNSLKKLISRYVLDALDQKAEFYRDLLDLVYDQAIIDPLVSIIYKDESYLKVLIMLIIHKACTGGKIE